MLELAQKYAVLKNATVIGHRITGKEITFILSNGPKLTMTESQLKLAISNLETPQAGTVAGDVNSETPPPASADGAAKPRGKYKKGD